MRLIKFINEKSSPDDKIESLRTKIESKNVEDEYDPEKLKNMKSQIEKECGQYVKEVGLFKEPIDRNNIFKKCLFRGVKAGWGDRLVKMSVRKDRKPRYIPERLHEHLGDLTKELFGWNTRTEGLFTGSSANAGNFGDLMVVIPIGKFKYVYLEGRDLEHLYLLYDMWMRSTKYDELEKVIRKYKTTGLGSFLKSRSGNDMWECIVNCKNYYIMSLNLIKAISRV